jgi:hypothetical protein
MGSCGDQEGSVIGSTNAFQTRTALQAPIHEREPRQSMTDGSREIELNLSAEPTNCTAPMRCWAYTSLVYKLARIVRTLGMAGNEAAGLVVLLADVAAGTSVSVCDVQSVRLSTHL